MKEKFTLTQDNDSHWYLIPAKKKSLWEKFLNASADPEDCNPPDAPDFAIVIGGAYSRVEFENPTIDGNPIKGFKKK